VKTAYTLVQINGERIFVDVAATPERAERR
jgi:hypothetical protein